MIGVKLLTSNLLSNKIYDIFISHKGDDDVKCFISFRLFELSLFCSTSLSKVVWPVKMKLMICYISKSLHILSREMSIKEIKSVTTGIMLERIL